VNNLPMKDNQRMLQVVAAEVYPSTSVLFGVSATATTGQLQTAYVQLKDVFGNNASNADVTFHIQASQGHTIVNGTVATTVRGLCEITYNLTVASYDSAVYNLVVLVNGDAVVNSFITIVRVVPADLAPSVSFAYGDGLKQSTAGYFAYFYVQLTDVFGNNKTELTASVAPLLTSEGVRIVPTALTSGTNGLYVYQYNATLANEYSLQVLVNEIQIANGGTTVAISPAAVNPSTTIAFGVGLAGDLLVGVNNQFYVQLRDAFSNNITTAGTEILKVEIRNDDITVNPLATFDNGLYLVSYNITRAATFALSVTINDAPILNSEQTITLLPGDIYPQESIATNVATEVIAGSLTRMQVQLRDVFGNDIVSVPDPSGVVVGLFKKAATNTTVDVAVQYSGPGQYNLTYNATTTGSYNLSILALNTPIKGGQYLVKVAPAAAYLPLCIVEGSGLATSVAGSLSSFNVYLFDAYNNTITEPAENETPIVTIGEQNIEVAFDTTLNAYVAKYTITLSATYAVKVVIQSSQITASSLVVSPASLAEANSLVNGTALYSAKAGANEIFYVYLRDVYNNIIADNSQVTSIQISMTQNTTTTPLPSVWQDGCYQVPFKFIVAGPYSTSIMVNGNKVAGSPFDTRISPGPFNPQGTVTNGLSNLVIAGDLNSFSIQLKDIYGNDVTDNDIAERDIAVLLNGTDIPINVAYPSAGVFLVKYNYTVAGSYWMNVTINGTEVGASPPGLVVIQAGDVYPPACTAEGEATEQATVKKTSYFKVIIRDRYENRHQWSLVKPLITLSADGQATYDGNAQQVPDGTYNVSYFASAKAVYTLSVTIGGHHIKGSPFSVTTNYGNSSFPTLVIVGSVLGGVFLVALIVGGYIIWRRRHSGYVTLE